MSGGEQSKARGDERQEHQRCWTMEGGASKGTYLHTFAFAIRHKHSKGICELRCFVLVSSSSNAEHGTFFVSGRGSALRAQGRKQNLSNMSDTRHTGHLKSNLSSRKQHVQKCVLHHFTKSTMPTAHLFLSFYGLNI
mmetsp:Transcript_1421/g.8765  ORF Transcript_1421/g.8765 Transcript_1421/m.8765 type:complete len:137 (-) Transcript_1421:2157-2567(-)